MRTIFVDSNFKCHPLNDGTMTAVETDFFDNKCDTFVEGFCCEPRENSTAIYSWKPYSELAAAQAQYEADQDELLADYQEELLDAYREGVNSV